MNARTIGTAGEIRRSLVFERLEDRLAPSAASLINLDAAKAQFPQLDGRGYTVAVLDSGIDYRHPALGGSFRQANSRVIDGYDFVDGRGGNYVEDDPTPGPDPDPLDRNGHGTNIAGVIGSSDGGMSGVAPAVRFAALRVLDRNKSGEWSWVASALQWVLDHQQSENIIAVNMSLGEGNYASSPSSFAAVDAKLSELSQRGVILVASSGNDFYKDHSAQGLEYPAIQSSVISVGAVYAEDYGPRTWPDGAMDLETAPDRIASFSQRGPALDLLAPGAFVASAGLSPGGTRTSSTYAGGSQAAAFVTGAAVLVRQAYDLTGRSELATPGGVKSLLISTGKRLTDGDDERDNVTNSGRAFPRLDVLAALREAMRQLSPDPGEPNDVSQKSVNLGLVAAGGTTLVRNWHAWGDVDWYMFRVGRAGTYRLSLSASPSLGSSQLVFHNVVKGSEQDIAASSVGGVVQIELSLKTGTNYFLEARGPAMNVGAYSVSLSPVSPPPSPASSPAPIAPTGSPAPDRFESNETSQKAKSLSAIGNARIENLSLAPTGDVDWFMFRTIATERKRIQLSADPASALSFTFHDVIKNQERTIAATRIGGGWTIDVQLRSGVNYFLEVRSSGAAANYSIEFSGIAAMGPTGGSLPAATRSASAGPMQASAIDLALEHFLQPIKSSRWAS